MELPPISIEQNNVLQQLLTNNVVVDSVAGSGKTTCILHISKTFCNKQILLLTYNSKLKFETREKVSKLKLHNLEVYSYHSFCVKYYDKQCFTDTVINKVTKNKKNPLNQFNFDLIVLDEAQDITSLYYELVCKIYNDNSNANSNICIFGDKNQSIFDFNKADQRFIEYSTELFDFNSNNWSKCNLSVSFRITYEMSLFINNCLLKEKRIISNKVSNNKPRYIICDCFEASRTLEEVKYYFNLGYKPSDIFILAPSIKGGESPIRKLENKIKREIPDVMVYVPINDNEKLDEEVFEGKIIFSTFHQTKGLERKVVLIFNFDDSYFNFYKTNANPYICSNELYVATTRGIEQLSLFHHQSNKYLPFLDKNKINLYCQVEESQLHIFKVNSYNPFQKNIENIDTSITDIIKYLPQNIIDECFNKLHIIPCPKYKISKINIPLKTSNEKTTESVSEITGIAIPSMFELKIKNKMNIFNNLIEKSCLIQPEQKKYNINNINLNNLTPQELLYISNCWNTSKNGYLFKMYQITNYEWLTEKKLNDCMDRLTELNISVDSLFECKICAENEIELLNRKLNGYVDCIDKVNNIMYEFKCVEKLDKEHYLQLAVYMYVYELDKIKNITNQFNKEKNEINKLIVELFEMKNKINQKISENSKFMDCESVICFKKTKECFLGDNIKYNLFDEKIGSFKQQNGKITKIYKTTGRVQVKNSDGELIDISKTIIRFVMKKLDINELNAKKAKKRNQLYELKNELENIENVTNKKKQELEQITIKFEDELKLQNKQTKYVLFNILTNEYLEIKCDFQNLKKIVKCLIYSKYVNNKAFTDEEFIKNNKNIYNLYFESCHV